MAIKTLQANVDGVVTVPSILAGVEFQQITGGGVTADTTADRAPGAQFQSKTGGVPDIADLVCTTPWDEDRFRPVLSQLQNAVSFAEDCTVGIIVRDKHGNRKGMTTYAPCVLVGAVGPEGNTTSNDQATLILTLSPNGIA